MSQYELRPTADQTFILVPAGAGDGFLFAAAEERSMRQERDGDYRGACQTRFLAFQVLMESLPDDDPVELDWQDEETASAMRLVHMSAIDHFLIGDWEMCAGQLELLLEMDPEDRLEATVTLAYAYVAMEEYDSLDEIAADMSEKSPDRALVLLWASFRRDGRLDADRLLYFRRYFTHCYEEFLSDIHPSDSRFLSDVSSSHPSREAAARELWLRTEHLWKAFPQFISALREDAAVGR